MKILLTIRRVQHVKLQVSIMVANVDMHANISSAVMIKSLQIKRGHTKEFWNTSLCNEIPAEISKRVGLPPPTLSNPKFEVNIKGKKWASTSVRKSFCYFPLKGKVRAYIVDIFIKLTLSVKKELQTLPDIWDLETLLGWLQMSRTLANRLWSFRKLGESHYLLIACIPKVWDPLLNF